MSTYKENQSKAGSYQLRAVFQAPHFIPNQSKTRLFMAVFC